jgi:hypothetical protein
MPTHNYPVSSQSQNRHEQFIVLNKRFAKTCGWLTFGLSFISIFAWFANLLYFNVPMPDFFNTTPLFTVVFLLLSLASLVKFDNEIGLWQLITADLVGIGCLLLGILSLGVSLHLTVPYIDQFLIENEIQLRDGINFMMLGLAILTYNSLLVQTAKIYQLFCMWSGVIMLFATLEYVLISIVRKSLEAPTQIDLFTFICSGLVCLCLMFSRPNHGWLRILTTPIHVSTLARRIMLAVIILPLLLAVLVVWGQQSGWYSSYDTMPLLVLLFIVIFSILFWQMTRYLYKNDIDLIQLTQSLNSKTDQLEEASEQLTQKIKELEESREEIRKILRYQDKVREIDSRS